MIRMKYDNELTKIRKALRLKQAELARELGISLPVYKRYEQELRPIPASLLNKLQDVLPSLEKIYQDRLNVPRLRQDLGLTREQMAKILGVGKSALIKWELGTRLIPISKLEVAHEILIHSSALYVSLSASGNSKRD